MILDALGVKGIWQTRNARKLVHRLYHVSDITRQHIDEPRFLHLDAEGVSKDQLSKDHASISFHTQTISDTVIITAHSGLPVGPLLRHLAVDLSGVYQIALAHGVIFRGAVSYGDYYRQGSVLVGPAVDEAAEWHALPDCAGVVLTPSAGDAVDKFVRSKGGAPYPGFVRLPVPLKGGVDAECWSLDWYRCHLPLTRLEEAFLRPPVTPEVARKLANTLSLCRGMWDALERRYPHSIKLPWRDVSQPQMRKWRAEMVAKSRELERRIRNRKRRVAHMRQYIDRLCNGNPRAVRILMRYLRGPEAPSLRTKRKQISQLRGRLSRLGVVLPSRPPSWLKPESFGAAPKLES